MLKTKIFCRDEAMPRLYIIIISIILFFLSLPTLFAFDSYRDRNYRDDGGRSYAPAISLERFIASLKQEQDWKRQVSLYNQPVVNYDSIRNIQVNPVLPNITKTQVAIWGEAIRNMPAINALADKSKFDSRDAPIVLLYRGVSTLYNNAVNLTAERIKLEAPNSTIPTTNNKNTRVNSRAAAEAYTREVEATTTLFLELRSNGIDVDLPDLEKKLFTEAKELIQNQSPIAILQNQFVIPATTVIKVEPEKQYYQDKISKAQERQLNEVILLGPYTKQELTQHKETELQKITQNPNKIYIINTQSEGELGYVIRQSTERKGATDNVNHAILYDGRGNFIHISPHNPDEWASGKRNTDLDVDKVDSIRQNYINVFVTEVRLDDRQMRAVQGYVDNHCLYKGTDIPRPNYHYDFTQLIGPLKWTRPVAGAVLTQLPIIGKDVKVLNEGVWTICSHLVIDVIKTPLKKLNENYKFPGLETYQTQYSPNDLQGAKDKWGRR